MYRPFFGTLFSPVRIFIIILRIAEQFLLDSCIPYMAVSQFQEM